MKFKKSRPKSKLQSTLRFIHILIRIIVLASVFNLVLTGATLAASTALVTTPIKNQDLQKILLKYAKASSIKSDIKKTDEKIILGSKSESQGIFKIQKDNIYILHTNDKKIEVFFMNKTLTLVEYPDSDFETLASADGIKRKVTILKKSTPPLIKNLLSLFSSPKNFNKEFSLISQKSEGNIQTIELKSAQKNIKNLNLKIDKKNLNLLELSFVDDVDTKTTLQFNNLKLNALMNKSEFQYKQLTTDEVITE